MRRITQNQLNRIIEKHRLWLKNRTNNKLADFHNMDFSYLDFNGADFRHADFSNAIFHCANLENVDFSHSNLYYADFHNAYVVNLKIRGAIIKGINPENAITDKNFYLRLVSMHQNMKERGFKI